MDLLLPGVTLAGAATKINDAANALSNVRGAGHQPFEMYNNYIRWGIDQRLVLSTTLSSKGMADLIVTDGYARLLQLNSSSAGPNLAALVDAEITLQVRQLEATVRDLRLEAERWRTCGLVAVPDTSLLMHHPHEIEHLPWRDLTDAGSERLDVVIPIAVVRELDHLKDRPTDRSKGNGPGSKTRARTTLRFITREFDDPGGIRVLEDGAGSAPGSTWCRLLLDPPQHMPLATPDQEIVERARAVRQVSQRQVTVIGCDTGLGLLTRAAGLRYSYVDQDDPAPTVQT